jgi:cytochrome c553
MKKTINHWAALAMAAGLLGGAGALWAGPDRPTEYTNQGSIINTRHNMTMLSQSGGDLLNGSVNPDNNPGGGGVSLMNSSRNQYGEVCVYCHTPHGANTNHDLPLWNRTIQNPTGYTTYDQLNTSTLTPGSVSQPGANSLSCMSCHDGVTAIDSIINMPGSGRFNKNQETAVDPSFLDQWPGAAGSHDNMTECSGCHNPTNTTFGNRATDFRVFIIGTDLRNDHPVGVTYPTTRTDFTPGLLTQGTAKYIDKNTNNKMDKNDLRIYNGKVECASCHDPHGVPSVGPGSTFNPTFLRVSNTNSGVCLTCHVL